MTKEKRLLKKVRAKNTCYLFKEKRKMASVEYKIMQLMNVNKSVIILLLDSFYV